MAMRAKTTPLFLRWQYFLNADLIDEMVALYVRQVRPFLVVCQHCTNPLCHNHHKSSVVHIEPIGTADQFVGSIPHKGAIWVRHKIWFVKSAGHLTLHRYQVLESVAYYFKQIGAENPRRAKTS